jgi:diaminopimelate decarboxylase
MDDDYVAIGQELPELAPGDVLELGNVGAYTLVFKPPFIRTQPAVYLRYRGALELARSEQTVDELLAGYRWEAT